MVELMKTDIYDIIVHYGWKNVKIAFMAVIICMLFRLILMILKRKTTFHEEKHNVSHIIWKSIGFLIWHLLFFLFISYLEFLAELTFFTREPNSRIGVNLQLFGTWLPDLQSQCYVIENVLLFVPLGMFLVLLWKKAGKVWEVLLISLLMSGVIEVSQLLTGRGYFQIDDIWLNVVGGLLGFDFGILLRELCQPFSKISSHG